MIDDFCKRYKLKRLEITHPLFHWLVLHCNCLLNRYLVKSDGLTPYTRRWEKEYNPPLCQFGETVMFNLSQPRANTDISWGRGLWLGRSTLNNEILVSTAKGDVIIVRTIRRLPPEEKQDKGLLDALKGTPWSPKGTAEVESTLPELALEQFRFAAGKQGPLKGEEETGTLTTERQPQQEDETTTGQGGATSSSSTKRPNTE